VDERTKNDIGRIIRAFCRPKDPIQSVVVRKVRVHAAGVAEEVKLTQRSKSSRVAELLDQHPQNEVAPV